MIFVDLFFLKTLYVCKGIPLQTKWYNCGNQFEENTKRDKYLWIYTCKYKRTK